MARIAVCSVIGTVYLKTVVEMPAHSPTLGKLLVTDI